MTTLQFLGAAGTVTGSKYLLETGGYRLLVDCGLFQGLKELRLRNWTPLPIHPASVNSVLLTHAHIDHSGYLPRFVRDGFDGTVYATRATKALLEILLPDSARLQEEDAAYANRHHYSKHKPALPLYTEKDARAALKLVEGVDYGEDVRLGKHLRARFITAGHILGSSFISVELSEPNRAPIKVLFSGDIGRYDEPILNDPAPVDEADYLLVESTYGDRVHPPDDDGAQLADIVTSVAARGGKLVIPAFAIGRVEEVIYWLKKLEDEKRIPSLPVFVDSPMAARALQFYSQRADELDPEMQPVARHICAFCTRRMTTVASPQQSKELVASRQPAIVIASSGMATGGRVLYHLQAVLPNERHSVLFVGFQAAGTRGRALLEGAQAVHIKGRDVGVRAQIHHLNSMSAHADSDEIMRWVGNFTTPPGAIYLVHGEPTALAALQTRMATEKGWQAHIARDQETVSV